MILVVRDREAGNPICKVRSREEGADCIRMFEQSDHLNGDYVPDFYEVAEVEDDYCSCLEEV